MSEAFYPGRAPIDAYGNGGFRFAGMGHKGSLLILPGGIYAWELTTMDDLDLTYFEKFFADKPGADFLLLGTGPEQIFPAPDIRRAFDERQLGLEPMDTGAACRTYNILLAEKRAVAAALIAVE